MQKIREELLSYSTAKMVKIRDSRLGVMNFVATLAILIYICFVMLRDQQYLYRESPVGSVRLSLRPPSLPVGNDSSSLPGYCEGSSSSYEATRLILACVNADESSVGFEGNALNSIYLPTRLNLSREVLVAGCTVPGTPGCTYDLLNKSAYYTANAEKWTFKISSSANAPTLPAKGSSDELEVRVALCKGTDSTQRYKTLSGSKKDIMTLEELLSYACWEDKPVVTNSTTSTSNSNTTTTKTVRQWIGTTLEQPSDHTVSPPLLPLSTDPTSPTFESIRYAGAIVSMAADFDNTYTYLTRKVRITYSFKRLPLTEYKTQKTLTSSDLTSRTVVSSHGIILISSVQGVFAQPRFQEFLVNLTSALGLLAFATFLVEFVMLHVLKEKELYSKEKESDSQRDFDNMRARLQQDQEMQRINGGRISVAPGPMPPIVPPSPHSNYTPGVPPGMPPGMPPYGQQQGYPPQGYGHPPPGYGHPPQGYVY